MPRYLRNALSALGWDVWNNVQPHIEFAAKRADCGAVLIGKLDGDLSWVPADNIASTASMLHMPAVLLTCQTPKEVLNLSMMQRNCYLLRYDQLTLLPAVLSLLKIEKERQQQAMVPSREAVAETSQAGDLMYSTNSIVDQLFRALLEREADEKALKHYGEYVAVTHRQDGIGRLARILSQSKEFRMVNVKRMSSEALGGIANVETSGYANVVSFGTHCYAGKLMQRDGLKKFSTPFDWVFSSADMIRHCIEDDFETFLDPAQHRSVKSDGKESVAEHLFYREGFGIQTHVFNHRDPNVDDNLAYYQRGVERMRRLLSDAAPLLCIMVTQEWVTSVEQATRLAETLTARAPAATLICLRVYDYRPQRQKFGLELTHQVGSHQIYDYFSTGSLGSLAFDNEIDTLNLQMLIRRLRANGPPPAASIAA